MSDLKVIAVPDELLLMVKKVLVFVQKGAAAWLRPWWSYLEFVVALDRLYDRVTIAPWLS